MKPSPSKRSTPALNSLQDLKLLQRELALQRRAEEERQERLAAAARLAEQERRIFELSIGPVTRLAASQQRVMHRLPPPAPEPLQREADERQVLLQALSDDFDVDTLLETDDTLSFRRPEITQEVVRKLRRGHWSLQAQLDLHGLRRDQAREALGQFVQDSARRGLRCVRVVHGKGNGSPGREPVLKARVRRWLVQKDQVLAFVQARASDGGSGALMVLLAGT
ncbi:Smr/MutS family protein [Paucibacter sp. DJ1R-11]|uniref:Smr/MutS family protein n=1 Tax=unclassified Roseateles TaxID=2626991 RepID=UPI0021E42889|nr:MULTISPECIES: Smr/MutS family protein [unclassified Roseateles]MCV2364154.1 Smr/MutS family protein [Paucibacter sp. DJ1R-11]MCV2422647.1 Smr/MutS family protein [Paucibacter sp. DJ4R-1]MCV2438845.1 Smr/MutS family protein [Paucibacter sp. DJ2R-2]